ncbi:Conserved_hypothetical protein [Hexamita inflata]|uniref:Uncharacterized protein n=1 Tax=Hexamita inflata TaxID=28002 RepID=A0AA86PJP2_9EUKA|nr:Conserved hypothetical protein [Hexamita inflata]CAI9967540.1 Conserved hypothetical protein [Hexamita inflata]
MDKSPTQNLHSESPYGKADPVLRKQRGLELLAAHARTWELQIAQNSHRNHPSVMNMDGEWRAKQRKLAQIDMTRTEAPELNWTNSLRTNDKVVERVLGRLNPIRFYIPEEKVNASARIVANLPDYIPVQQRLPTPMRNQNIAALQRLKIQDDEHSQLELSLQNISGEFTKADLEPRARSAQIQTHRTDLFSSAIMNSPPHQVRTNTFSEPPFKVDQTIFPHICINNLTCISSNSYTKSTTAELVLQNLGDCVLEMSLQIKQVGKEKSTKDRPESPAESEKNSEKYKLQSIMQRASPKRRDTACSVVYSPPRTTFAKTTFAEKAHLNQTKRQNTVQLHEIDNSQKLIEKSSTPSHLKILAQRCVKSDRGNVESKIIVATPGKRFACGVGEFQKVKFLIPKTAEGNLPGIILQEYELCVKPACQVSFINQDDIRSGFTSVTHQADQTIIQIRCYGINSHCLQLTKQLNQSSQKGVDRMLQIYNKSVCKELLYDFADQAIEISNQKQAEDLKCLQESKGILKQIEQQVIECYEQNIVKAKWIKDKTERKQFLYEIVCQQRCLKLDCLDKYIDLTQILNLCSKKEYLEKNMHLFDSNQQHVAKLCIKHGTQIEQTAINYAISNTKMQIAKYVQLEENNTSKTLKDKILDNFLLILKAQWGDKVGYDNDCLQLLRLICCLKQDKEVCIKDIFTQSEKTIVLKIKELEELLNKLPDVEIKPGKIPQQSVKQYILDQLLKDQNQSVQQTNLSIQVEQLDILINLLTQNTILTVDQLEKDQLIVQLVKSINQIRYREKQYSNFAVSQQFYNNYLDNSKFANQTYSDVQHLQQYYMEHLEKEVFIFQSSQKQAPQFDEELKQQLKQMQFGKKVVPAPLKIPDTISGLYFMDTQGVKPQLLEAAKAKLEYVSTQPQTKLQLKQLLVDAMSLIINIEALPAEPLNNITFALRNQDQFKQKLQMEKDKLNKPVQIEVDPKDKNKKKPVTTSQLTATQQTKSQPKLDLKEQCVYYPLDNVSTCNIQDLKHQMRLEIFRKEFDVFIDALFDEKTQQVEKVHVENTLEYDGRLQNYEEAKIQQLEAELPIKIPVKEEYQVVFEPFVPKYQYKINFTQVQAFSQILVKELNKLKLLLTDGKDQLALIINKLTNPTDDELIQVCKTFNITLQIQKQIQVQNTLQTQLDSSLQTIQNIFSIKEHDILLAPGSILDATDQQEIVLDNIQIFDWTPEYVKYVQDQLQILQKDLKPKDTPRLSNTQIPQLDQQKDTIQEQYEEEIDVKIPPYLREVNDQVKAKQEVWAFLFNQMLDRTSLWFAGVENLELFIAKCGNYILRPWNEFVE